MGIKKRRRVECALGSRLEQTRKMCYISPGQTGEEK